MQISIKENREIRHRPEDDLTQEEANELLKNSAFARQTSKESNIPITLPEIKTKRKPLINLKNVSTLLIFIHDTFFLNSKHQ